MSRNINVNKYFPQNNKECLKSWLCEIVFQKTMLSGSFFRNHNRRRRTKTIHTQQFLQNILKFAFINHLAKHFSNNYAPFLDASDTILSARLMIVVVLDIVARRGAAKIIAPENSSIFTICLGHSANVTPSDFYSPLNCPRFSVQKIVAYSILPGKHTKNLGTNLGNQMTNF